MIKVDRYPKLSKSLIDYIFSNGYEKHWDREDFEFFLFHGCRWDPIGKTVLFSKSFLERDQYMKQNGRS